MGIAKIDWKAQSQSFDRVAELYDAYRPGYPTELIESIIALTGIGADAKILEIGSGTGKATEPFAKRGFSILCLEPGKNLAAVAAEKFRQFPQVKFEHARFEEWEEHPEEFDLVMSAQAFHWVPKEIRYAKAARTLKVNGHLALFWNRYPNPQGTIFDELEHVYRERAPELVSEEPWSLEKQIDSTQAEIAASGCFEEPKLVTFSWSKRYYSQQYLGLLNTYSDHLQLNEATRENLFASIGELIDQHGGHIEIPYLTALHVAEKK